MLKYQQYVVGTGGAHPDYVKGKNGDTHEVAGVKYTMESHIPGYGYLEVTSDDTKFIKVIDWRPYEAKGGKKKRKTHKRIHHRNKKSRKHSRK